MSGKKKKKRGLKKNVSVNGYHAKLRKARLERRLGILDDI